MWIWHEHTVKSYEGICSEWFTCPAVTKAESMEYNNQASNSGLQQIIRKKGFRRAVAAIANTCHFPAVRKSTQQLLYWLLSARHGPKEEWGRNNSSKGGCQCNCKCSILVLSITLTFMFSLLPKAENFFRKIQPIQSNSLVSIFFLPDTIAILTILFGVNWWYWQNVGQVEQREFYKEEPNEASGNWGLR